MKKWNQILRRVIFIVLIIGLIIGLKPNELAKNTTDPGFNFGNFTYFYAGFAPSDYISVSLEVINNGNCVYNYIDIHNNETQKIIKFTIPFYIANSLILEATRIINKYHEINSDNITNADGFKGDYLILSLSYFNGYFNNKISYYMFNEDDKYFPLLSKPMDLLEFETRLEEVLKIYLPNQPLITY